MENQDNSISAYVNTLSFSDTGADTDYTEIASRGHSRIVKTRRDGRWVVLKGLKPEKVFDSLCLAMLGKEYAIAVQMNHPNIVQVYSRETNAELGPCIVMEYVDGRTLADFLAEKPSKKQRLKVLRELLSAMRYYHSLQIVHRDLKPSNILVTRKGDNVKIIDFGLADSDDYAVLKGPAYTKAYAAPEQMRPGVAVDSRADIYAFGVLLKELFPHRYCHVARRCTKADPQKRYPSAKAVEKALRRADEVRKYLLLTAVVAAMLVGMVVLVEQFVKSNVPAQSSENQLVLSRARDLEDSLMPGKTVVLESEKTEPTPNKKEPQIDIASLTEKSVAQFRTICDSMYKAFRTEVSSGIICDEIFELKAQCCHIQLSCWQWSRVYARLPKPPTRLDIYGPIRKRLGEVLGEYDFFAVENEYAKVHCYDVSGADEELERLKTEFNRIAGENAKYVRLMVNDSLFSVDS